MSFFFTKSTVKETLVELAVCASTIYFMTLSLLYFGVEPLVNGYHSVFHEAFILASWATVGFCVVIAYFRLCIWLHDWLRKVLERPADWLTIVLTRRRELRTVCLAFLLCPPFALLTRVAAPFRLFTGACIITFWMLYGLFLASQATSLVRGTRVVPPETSQHLHDQWEDLPRTDSPSLDPVPMYFPSAHADLASQWGAVLQQNPLSSIAPPAYTSGLPTYDESQRVEVASSGPHFHGKFVPCCAEHWEEAEEAGWLERMSRWTRC